MISAEILPTVFLSLKNALISTAVNLPLALGVVYLLTKKDFRGKSLLEGFIQLPLVMPPVTTGYLLLLLLGKRGLIGAPLFSLFGLRVAFTPAAAVIASMVVSFPLITRSLKISMEMIDTRLESVAHTLGAGRLEVLWRVTLPLILPGIISGAVLGFARSLGEFGATITFAGNIQGLTRTIPLSVHTLLQIPGKEKNAAVLVLISIILSFAAMLVSSQLNRQLRKRRGETP